MQVSKEKGIAGIFGSILVGCTLITSLSLSSRGNPDTGYNHFPNGTVEKNDDLLRLIQEMGFKSHTELLNHLQEQLRKNPINTQDFEVAHHLVHGFVTNQQPDAFSMPLENPSIQYTFVPVENFGPESDISLIRICPGLSVEKDATGSQSREFDLFCTGYKTSENDWNDKPLVGQLNVQIDANALSASTKDGVLNAAHLEARTTYAAAVFAVNRRVLVDLFSLLEDRVPDYKSKFSYQDIDSLIAGTLDSTFIQQEAEVQASLVYTFLTVYLADKSESFTSNEETIGPLKPTSFNFDEGKLLINGLALDDGGRFSAIMSFFASPDTSNTLRTMTLPINKEGMPNSYGQILKDFAPYYNDVLRHID